MARANSAAALYKKNPEVDGIDQYVAIQYRAAVNVLWYDGLSKDKPL